MSEKLDIFRDILPKLNDKNSSFFDNLTDDEKKQIQPYALYRFMSGGTDSEYTTLLLDSIVNTRLFDLSKNHKGILVKLLAICGTGSYRRYAFLQSKKKTPPSIILNLIRKQYTCSTREAIDYMPLLSDDDILTIAVNYAVEKDDLRKIKAALKKRQKAK